MKKRFLKTLGTCILAGMIMASTMAVTASAEGTTRSITVNVMQTGVTGTFNVYKVASATKTGNAYNYDYVGEFAGKGLANLETLTSSNVKAFAASLVDLATTPVNPEAIAISNAGVKIENLDPGYYLIVADTTNSGIIAAPSLVAITDADGTANIKSSKISFEKKITAINKGGSISQGSDPSDTGIGEIGATVSYSLKTQFPKYAEDVTSIEDFTITDDPSDGITYNKNNANIKVYVDDSQITTGYSVVGKGDNGYTGDGFTITFDDATVTDNGGKSVKVTFDATINDKAVIGTDNEGEGNPNEAKLKYGNQYATGQGETEITDKVKVYTTKITVNKKGEDGNALTGAGFTIYDTDGTPIKTINSTADIPLSTFEFVGLDEGTYTIRETTVPDGYKKAEDITVTVGAKKENNEYVGKFLDSIDNSIIEVSSYSKDVTNIRGKELPGTGGIGTTIFTVAGVTMIAGAGALLTVYMRKRKKEEE